MKRSANPYPGRIRIIGGKWRGRFIDVLGEPDLRPTGSRIRETLFNWLMPVINGACCLDLFAGSGALGFEAASRNAAEVVMIDSDPAKVKLLQATVRRFRADNIGVVRADALEWLGRAGAAFDVVFLDPPFRQALVLRCCEALVRHALLRDGALVYMEVEKDGFVPQLPPGWTLRREKQAGRVCYLLAAAGRSA